MSITYCENCQSFIDEDHEASHKEICKESNSNFLDKADMEYQAYKDKDFIKKQEYIKERNIKKSRI